MSRTANADDLRLAIRAISANYENIFRPQIEILEAAIASGRLPRSPQIDESREVHRRTFIVNSLLEALNWRMSASPADGLPNLVPEAAVASTERGTRRYLDYLGYEVGTANPLMIVETKRAAITLPSLTGGTVVSTRAEVFSRGLAGESLTGDWSEWLLRDVGDYVRSVHAGANRVPARVVITNGDWLVLFSDPADAFLAGGTKTPGQIFVYESLGALAAEAPGVFELLEQSRVAGGLQAASLADLSFCVAPASVHAAMYGLRLLYDREPGINAPTVPLIKVSPVVFVGSGLGAWVCVQDNQNDYPLPTDPQKLPGHLAEVQGAAEGLLAQINGQLGTALIPRSIEEHYADPAGFNALRGVTSAPDLEQRFLLVTGARTHYLSPVSSVPGCRFHDYAEAAGKGVASDLVTLRTTNPRSFFHSKELHHCAHSGVKVAKASPVSAVNAPRCGPRSRGLGQAFCEIWEFETHLCCRTCAYETVCTRAEVFHLPCSSLVQAPAGEPGSAP